MPRHREVTNASIHQASFVDTTDPSSVYSGEVLINKLWLDRAHSPRSLKIRNAGDTAWEVVTWYNGSGTPESSVTATPGFLYIDYTNGELYIKVTGTGNTGWKKMTHA